MAVIYYAAMISHRGLIRIFPSYAWAGLIVNKKGQYVTIARETANKSCNLVLEPAFALTV
jgi:hypothetical protein